MPSEDKFAKKNDGDEFYYFDYSRYILENGITSYPKLFQEHVRNQDNWIWPTPLRVGYFILASAWFKLFGPSCRSLAYLSFFAYIIFLAASFYFSRKFFGKGFATCFVLLLAYSPLAMAMAKRALSDSLGNMFITISLWLFLSFLLREGRARMLNFIFFIYIFSYSILVREQFALFLIFFLLYFLFFKYIYKEKIAANYGILLVALPLAIAGVVWLFSSGSLSSLLLLLKINRTLPAINQYSLLFCRGPWFRYLMDYLIISPWVTVLSLSFFIYALFIARENFLDKKITYFLISFLVIYLILNSFDYNKNVRYALSLDMIMRLFCLFLLKDTFKKSRFSTDFVFAAVLLLCIIDYFNFSYLFCKMDLYDPVSFRLLKARLFIP